MTLAFTQDDFNELAAAHPAKYAVSYDDAQQMGKRTLTKSMRFVPEFAANDAQLQAVLLHAALKYAFRNKPIPPDFAADLDTVIRLARDRSNVRREQIENGNYSKQLQEKIYWRMLCVEQAGGYVAGNAAVAYRCWRLMWPTHLVAKELGLSSGFVVRVKAMLVFYAKELGFPTYAPGQNWSEPKYEQIADLWEQGFSVPQIATKVHQEQDKIRAALKELGLYVAVRRRPDYVNKGSKTRWAGHVYINTHKRRLARERWRARKLGMTVAVYRNSLRGCEVAST